MGPAFLLDQLLKKEITLGSYTYQVGRDNKSIYAKSSDDIGSVNIFTK